MEAVQVLGLWRTLWLRYCYRPFMRTAHRFGWHYAPRNEWLTDDRGWSLHRCQWCGLAGFVAGKGLLAKPLDVTLSAARKPDGLDDAEQQVRGHRAERIQPPKVTHG